MAAQAMGLLAPDLRLNLVWCSNDSSFLGDTKRRMGRKAGDHVHVSQQNDTHLPIGLGHTLQLVFFLSAKAVGI